MKRPKLVRDYKNGYVKSLKAFENGLGKVPEGTIFLITSATYRAYLITDPCECCGVQFKFSIKGKNKFDEFEWLGYERPHKSNVSGPFIKKN